jgi:hypothetical protein
MPKDLTETVTDLPKVTIATAAAERAPAVLVAEAPHDWYMRMMADALRPPAGYRSCASHFRPEGAPALNPREVAARLAEHPDEFTLSGSNTLLHQPTEHYFMQAYAPHNDGTPRTNVWIVRARCGCSHMSFADDAFTDAYKEWRARYWEPLQARRNAEHTGSSGGLTPRLAGLYRQLFGGNVYD